MAMIWRFAFPRRAERHIAREPLSEVKFVVCVDRGIVAGTRNGNVSQSLVNAFLSCLSHVHVHQNALTSEDRKSTRLNSSHVEISYAVFCLKKKKKYKEK